MLNVLWLQDLLLNSAYIPRWYFLTYEFFKIIKGDVRYFLRLVGLVILFQDMVEYEVARLFLERTHLMYSLCVYFLGMLLGDIITEPELHASYQNLKLQLPAL
jgi:hypothetical protein